VLEETQARLRVESNGAREALTLWAGRTMNSSSVYVSHVITPHVLSDHSSLTVPFDERAHIATYLRQEQLLAVADLHTHPRAAFLSDADQRRPLSRRDGFFAVVVPDFASGGAGVGWRFYVSKSGVWSEVSATDTVDGWAC
jgi:proteasome lid subunit RPN8/RPN11